MGHEKVFGWLSLNHPDVFRGGEQGLPQRSNGHSWVGFESWWYRLEDLLTVSQFALDEPEIHLVIVQLMNERLKTWGDLTALQQVVAPRPLTVPPFVPHSGTSSGG